MHTQEFLKKNITYLFLAANFIFIVALVLLAEKFQISKNIGNVFFIWAVVCLPFALLTNKPSFIITSLVIAMFWFFLETGKNNYPLSFPVFLLASVYVLYRGKQSFWLFFIALVAALLWFSYTFSEIFRAEDYQLKLKMETGILILGLIALGYFLGLWLQQQRGAIVQVYGKFLVLLMSRASLLLVLIFSTRYAWLRLLRDPWEHQQEMLFVLGLIAMISLFFAYKTKKIKELLAISSVLLFTLALVQFSNNINHAVYFQIAGSVTAISCFLFLLYQQKKNHALNVISGLSGVFFVLLLVFILMFGHMAIGAVAAVFFAAILLFGEYHLRIRGKRKI